MDEDRPREEREEEAPDAARSLFREALERARAAWERADEERTLRETHLRH